MIREANAYTGEPGFRLHRDYGNASHVLGDADSDACDVAIPLGSKDGKPLFIAGTHDNALRIIARL